MTKTVLHTPISIWCCNFLVVNKTQPLRNFSRVTTATPAIFTGHRRRPNRFTATLSSPGLAPPRPLFPAAPYGRPRPTTEVNRDPPPSLCRSILARCRPSAGRLRPTLPLSFDLVAGEVPRDCCDLPHADEQPAAEVTSRTPTSSRRPSVTLPCAFFPPPVRPPSPRPQPADEHHLAHKVFDNICQR